LVKEFEMLCKALPGNFKFPFYLGLIHAERGDISSANELLKKVFTQTKDHEIEVIIEQINKASTNNINMMQKESGQILAISSKHNILVSSTHQIDIQIKDLASSSVLWKNSGYYGWGVTCVTISSEFGLFAAAGGDNRIRIWDLACGKFIYLIDKIISKLKYIVFHPKEHLLVYGTENGEIGSWDFDTHETTRKFLAADDPFIYKFSPDGEYLYVGAMNNIQIWNFFKAEKIYEFEWRTDAYNSFITGADFCLSKKIAVLDTYDNGLLVLDLSTGQKKFIFEGEYKNFSASTSICISPDGNYFVVHHRWETDVINLSSNERIFTFPWTDRTNEFSPNGRLLAIGATVCPFELLIEDLKRGIRSYNDLTFAGKICNYSQGKPIISSMCFSESSEYFMFGDNDGFIEVWNIGPEYGTGKLVQKFDTKILPNQNENTGFEGHGGSIKQACISEEKPYILTSGVDRTARLWDIKDGKCIRIIQPQSGDISDISILSWANYAILGFDNNGMIQIWDLFKNYCVTTLEGNSGKIKCLKLIETDDSFFVGSLFSDKTIKIWEIKNFNDNQVPIFVLSGSKDSAIDFIPLLDEGKIIIANEDKTIKIWDINKSECLKTLKYHIKQIRSLAISNDKQFIVSANLDGQIWVWDIANGDCNVIQQNLNATKIYVDNNGPRDFIVVSNNGEIYSFLLDQNYKIFPIVFPFKVIKPKNVIELGNERQEFSNHIMLANKLIASGNIKEAVDHLSIAHQIPVHGNSIEWSDAWSELGIYGIRKEKYEALLVGNVGIIGTIYSTPSNYSKTRFILGNQEILLANQWGGLKIFGIRDFKQIYSLDRSIIKDKNYIGFSFNELVVSRNWKYLLLPCSVDKYYSIFRKNIMVVDLKNSTNKLLIGHTDDVTTICISNNNKFAVSGSKDETIRLWDIEKGGCVGVFGGHNGKITAVSISPDCKYFASGSDQCENGSILIWDVFKGVIIQRLKLAKLDPDIKYDTKDEATSTVYGLSFSIDGQNIIAEFIRKTFTWDWVNGQVIHIEPYSSHSIDFDNTVGFSPNFKYKITKFDEENFKISLLAWEYDFPQPSNWDERIKPYIDIFLNLHPPRIEGWLQKKVINSWTENDFVNLISELRTLGFGWVTVTGIRKKIEEISKTRKSIDDL
jgi:WD40 repeat protein